MVFIETSHFSHWVTRYFKDDEYRELQNYLMEHPEAGVIIKGGGGIRKLRWAREGTGKSGGARIIYYWAKPLSQIYMLTAYAKNEKENMDAVTLARIAKQLGEMK
jgi:hypothetical protein